MDQQTGGAPKVRIGERLAAERRAQAVALADIATRTRIPLRTLETLEAGSSEGLPALTYTAGFVRSYANALGMDGAECARQFRAEMGAAPQAYVPEAYQVADPARVPSRLLAIVALIAALLIAGGYAIWRGDGLFGGGAEERARLAAGTDAPTTNAAPDAATAASQATTDAQAATGALVPAASAPGGVPIPDGPVVLTAREPVWFKVYERDGRTLYMGTLDAGKRFVVPADADDPMIRTGRPQALAVTVGGAAMPAIGAADTLVKDRSLRRAALIGGAPASATLLTAPSLPPTSDMAAGAGNP